MNTQKDLFMSEPRKVDLNIALNGYSKADKEAFAAWFVANRFVWKEFERMALIEIKKGAERLGSKKICEDVRKLHRIEIDNDHTAKLARVFAAAYPEHAGLFEFRAVNRRAV